MWIVTFFIPREQRKQKPKVLEYVFKACFDICGLFIMHDKITGLMFYVDVNGDQGAGGVVPLM